MIFLINNILYLCYASMNVCFSTMQIKRCGEMARKLRLFKEQMTKAGLSPSTRITRSNDIDLDNLEVAIYCNIDFFFFKCP